MRGRRRRALATRRRGRTPPPGADRRRIQLRTLANVLILTGALLLADVAVTLAWREPVTWLLQRGDRARQAEELARQREALRSAQIREALDALRDDRARLQFLARRARTLARRGEAVGRVQVPRTDRDDPIVYGTGADELREGPALFPEQQFPGLPGTAAIAGHRTTYGAPFRDLDDLRRGDRVTVRMPYGRFDYRVADTRIVAPDALWVLRRRARDRVVLTACHPLYSDAQRIVVSADLVRVRVDLGMSLRDIPLVDGSVGQPARAAQALAAGPPMR